LIKATPAEGIQVVQCEDCQKVIIPGKRVSCFDCTGKAIVAAEDMALREGAKDQKSAPKLIREWIARRFILGQISHEVRAELELCADDIECKAARGSA
jgi:hypothetical protein